MTPNFTWSVIDVKRILRELTILGELEHPNVIKLYNVEAVDTFNELYMVMELCDYDLHTLLQKDVTLPPQDIYKWLYSLLCGLSYLHSAGTET